MAESIKEKFITRLKGTGREGIGFFIEWLENETDFFEAPASMNHHTNFRGGLLSHSWNVLQHYESLIERMDLDDEMPYESIVIEALLHDVCKIRCYEENDEPASDKQISYLKDLLKQHGKKFNRQRIKDITKRRASDLIQWIKEEPESDPPKPGINWRYNDEFLPAGHGEKSVMIIQQFIELKPREMLAIRWHMGPWEQGLTAGGTKLKSYRSACEMYPDVELLYLADQQATFQEDWKLR
ncbi:MAG: hypothetical protein ACOCTM_03015 [Bacteroidota bacterium]